MREWVGGWVGVEKKEDKSSSLCLHEDSPSVLAALAV